MTLGRKIKNAVADDESREHGDADEVEEDNDVDRDARSLFFANQQAGGVDVAGDLFARAVAGPMVSNAKENPSDEERRDKHAAMLAAIESMPGVRGVSYDSQRKAFSAALKRAEVTTSRVTHVGRAAAASMVAQSGRNLDDQLRKHGHWNKDAMSNCYVESFCESVLYLTETTDRLISLSAWSDPSSRWV